MGVSENDLTKIEITSENENQFIWKDSKEFSYKGTMFDVVHIETIDKNTKIYHCISDAQETKLIAKYNTELQKKNRSKTNRTNPLKVFQFLEKIASFPQKQELAWNNKTLPDNFGYFNNYVTLSPEITSPPPKPVLLILKQNDALKFS